MSVLSRIGSFLPPPTYLRLPSVGVDISDTSLKYIAFQPDTRSGQHLDLQYWGDIDIEAGALSRGHVADIEKLTKALKEVKDRTGAQYVRVSLPEERAYIFETQIKKGTEFKEVRGLLEFRLEENVPLSPRDAYFDYHIFEPVPESQNLHVSVTAYAKETIAGYHEACLTAGVTPLSFEVEAQAIARAALPPDDPHTTLIVDFGKTRTGIGIVYKGVLMYTSTIDIGGKQLSSALRKQLGDLPEHELTKIKNEQGLVRGVENSDAFDSMLTTMSAIKDEIALRIQYWHNHDQSGHRFIDQIILCGGSANLKGLPGYFAETLDIDVNRAEVWGNAFSFKDAIPPIGRRYSYGYATAIGLALTSYL